MLADAREALADAWSHPDFYAGVSAAIRPLVPASEPGIVRWRGLHEAPERLDRGGDARFDLPYARTGEWTRSLPYDPSRRDPLAGKVVDTDQLERAGPEVVGRFREAFLRPAGLPSILRVTVYDGPHLLTVCGFMRSAGESRFSSHERAMFQAVVPDLVEGMTARRAAITSCE